MSLLPCNVLKVTYSLSKMNPFARENPVENEWKGLDFEWKRSIISFTTSNNEIIWKSFIHQQRNSFVKTTFTQYLKDKLTSLKSRSLLSKVGDGCRDNLSGDWTPGICKGPLQILMRLMKSCIHSQMETPYLARLVFGEGRSLFVHEGSSSRWRFARSPSTLLM